jgi:hypothetical protein
MSTQERFPRQHISSAEVLRLVRDHEEVDVASLALLELALSAVAGAVSRAKSDKERAHAQIVAGCIQARINEAPNNSREG